MIAGAVAQITGSLQTGLVAMSLKSEWRRGSQREDMQTSPILSFFLRQFLNEVVYFEEGFPDLICQVFKNLQYNYGVHCCLGSQQGGRYLKKRDGGRVPRLGQTLIAWTCQYDATLMRSQSAPVVCPVRVWMDIIAC